MADGTATGGLEDLLVRLEEPIALSGSCSGYTASSVTLTEGTPRALHQGMPGFVALDVEPEDAPAHPPPGATPVQRQQRPG